MTPVTIQSMSIVNQTSASDGVFQLTALPGATGTYTVTVTDGTATQTFTVNVGANAYDPPNPWVAPIDNTDQLTTPANTAVSFIPQGESADNSAVQVNAQLLLPVPAVPGAYVDSSYTGTNPPSAPNTSMTLTSTPTANGIEYTATPASGSYGVQVLEVTGQSATPAAWDSSAGVNPVYTAFVPVYVDPPAPQIASISSNGQTVTGTTSGNNSSAASTLSFDVTGAVSGATVSVYMDYVAGGDNTPIITGTVAANSTTITLTTTAGSPTISAGSHEFTVAQTLATSAVDIYADWTGQSGNQSPGIQYTIPASSVSSPVSAATALTIVAPGSLSGYAYLDPQDAGVKETGDEGFAGLTVELQSVNGQGTLSDVPGVGPLQTAADGSYSFTGLPAGTYQIQFLPPSNLTLGALTPGTASGIVGNDEIQVVLAAGQSGADYNFGIVATTSPHAAPSVATGSSAPVSYTPGGAAVAIVPNAAITAPDSPTLTEVTVTLESPPDGSSEVLSATTTGTTLTSSYANGVLTINGVAGVATYETVLQSVQYSDTATTATTGDRTIFIGVNDGTDLSPTVATTVDVS